MRVPEGYYKVYIVHVGPQIRDMFTEIEEAAAAVKRLVQGGEPAEFEEGLQEFVRKCFDRGRGNKTTLTMAEARRQIEKLEAMVEAWRKGRR